MEIPYLFANQIKKLPNSPGVYKFFNSGRELVYVGKAKDLKKRVTSYFTKGRVENRKTLRMVSETKTIEFTIVNSESDALQLENSLIKKNQPRYNINLKDDKSFPYICVSNERFPRVYSTRRRDPKKGVYFGPYTSVKAMNNVLNLIRSLYTIRTCKYNLSEENIKAGKFKVCLEYHIQNCKGPCEGLQTEEDYNKDIDLTTQILKGNLGVVREHFKKDMKDHAQRFEFELAEKYKEKLSYLEKFQSRSLVVNPKIDDLDVFSIVSDEKKAYVNFLKILKGSINLTQTVEIKKKLNEEDTEILPHVILDLREKFKSLSSDVIGNLPIELPLEGVHFSVPKIGDKKKLIALSLKNALYFKKERLNTTFPESYKRILEKLQEDLKLKTIPNHIECFDNSNIQGANPVASMVCFRGGKPSKGDYRHFNIKTVVGADDFASMYEVTNRRYSHLIREDKDLPDLIVIDGGKGQLNAAVKSLKDLGIYGKIPVVGIAKRLEEIYFPEDPFPLHIEKKSESLKLIQRIRNEAHRFAITFHRNKRSEQGLKSQLEQIDGIGEKTMDKLLRSFQSLKKIKEATVPELAKAVGKHKAEIVKQALIKQ